MASVYDEFTQCFINGIHLSLTSLCDTPALPSYTGVPQEPPLSLHPHLTLQVMLLWDLRGLMDKHRDRD